MKRFTLGFLMLFTLALGAVWYEQGARAMLQALLCTLAVVAALAWVIVAWYLILTGASDHHNAK